MKKIIFTILFIFSAFFVVNTNTFAGDNNGLKAINSLFNSNGWIENNWNWWMANGGWWASTDNWWWWYIPDWWNWNNITDAWIQKVEEWKSSTLMSTVWQLKFIWTSLIKQWVDFIS